MKENDKIGPWTKWGHPQTKKMFFGQTLTVVLFYICAKQKVFIMLRDHFNMTSSWLGGWVVWKCSFPDDHDDK